jgi:hypothetical protein
VYGGFIKREEQSFCKEELYVGHIGSPEVLYSSRSIGSSEPVSATVLRSKELEYK